MKATLKDIEWWDRASLFTYLEEEDKGQDEKQIRNRALVLKNKRLSRFKNYS